MNHESGLGGNPGGLAEPAGFDGTDGPGEPGDELLLAPLPTHGRRLPVEEARMMGVLPRLALRAFARSVPQALPPAPTATMPQAEWDAHRRIEEARSAVTPTHFRALARTFRRAPLPSNRILTRAAMVEALLRGPCSGADEDLVVQLLSFHSPRDEWRVLRAK